MDAFAEFTHVLKAAGLTPGRIIADGRIHRCPAKDEGAGKKSGWYLLHVDGIPAGAYGDWRTGEHHTWRARQDARLDPAEYAKNRAAIARQKAQRQAQQEAQHQKAQRNAWHYWRQAMPASPEHPYLQKKQIGVHGIRQWKGALHLPLRDTQGVLWNLQTITAEGVKRFLPGGRKRGLYLAIGGAIDEVLCVAEGYATAASIHEATGYPVACAFDCGNLQPVALSLREKYPDARIVICADDDKETEQRIGKNPGLDAARQAAAAVGGIVITPNFAGTGNTDSTSEGAAQ